MMWHSSRLTVSHRTEPLSFIRSMVIERWISSIVEEKISALQFEGSVSAVEAVQKPDALEEDVAKMLDNLDLFG